jgi:MFS family permease
MTQTLDEPRILPPRWRDLVAPDLLSYSVILGGGVVLHAMNVFVSATIMPSVVKEIGGVTYYAWATSLFVMFSIVSAALTARLTHWLGPKNAYLFAFGVFCVGTMICGLSSNIGMFNVGRAIQGAGGGFLYALAYTVIRAVFPDRLWPLAIGLITLMWGVATMTGPAIGGIFAELDAWRSAFFVLVPIALALSILCVLVLPGRSDQEQRGAALPWVQLFLLLAIVTVVSVGSTIAGTLSIGIVLTFSAMLLVVLLRVEKAANGRLLPVTALHSKSKLGALYLFLAFMMLGMQPEAFVPYFLQVLQGQSPLIAGYMGALMALGWTLASVLSAKFSGRRAENTLVLGAGFSFSGLAVQVLLLPTYMGSWSSLCILALGLVLVGFGIGYCWPHLTTKIFKTADRAEQDTAAAAVTTVQLFATALGASLAGMIANAGGMIDPGGEAGASSAAFWLFLIFLLAPATALAFARKALAPAN